MNTSVADVIDLKERRDRRQRAVVVHGEPINLTVVGETHLGEIRGKPTQDCRTNPCWDPNWYFSKLEESWLPVEQPTTPACIVTSLKPSRLWNPTEAGVTTLNQRIALALLGLNFIGLSLIRQGYLLSIPQIEALIELAKLDGGKKVGIPMDGLGAIVFLGTGSPLGPVSAGCIRCSQGRWSFRLYTPDTSSIEAKHALNANVLVPNWIPF